MLKAARRNLPLFKSTVGSLLVGMMLAGCGPQPDIHPGQPVTKRKIVFRGMLRAFEPMALVIRGRESYDRDKFLKHAIELESLAKQPWSYFTPGSYYPPTKASPAIWKYPAEFKSKEQKLIDSTAQLARVSQTGNLDAIRPAYENVLQACNSCHHEFRQSSF